MLSIYGLPYTRFCNCLLDYDCVLHIVNFSILYFSSEGLFHATPTAIQDFSLLWNHHCSWETNVRGFFGPPLPMNLHPHEHVFIPSLIFINSISNALFICYPHFTSPWTSKICFTHEHWPPRFKIILQYMASFVRLAPKFTMGFKPGMQASSHLCVSTLTIAQHGLWEIV
jgi:hypothetical protein